MRDVVKWFVLAVDIVAMFGMVAGILMHSGRGGGLSDMFGGAAGASLGSTAAERNLTRITLVLALVWVFSTVSLGLLLD